MKHTILLKLHILPVFVLVFLTSCATVDLNAPIPVYDPGIDPTPGH